MHKNSKEGTSAQIAEVHRQLGEANRQLADARHGRESAETERDLLRSMLEHEQQRCAAEQQRSATLQSEVNWARQSAQTAQAEKVAVAQAAEEERRRKEQEQLSMQRAQAAQLGSLLDDDSAFDLEKQFAKQRESAASYVRARSETEKAAKELESERARFSEAEAARVKAEAELEAERAQRKAADEARDQATQQFEQERRVRQALEAAANAGKPIMTANGAATGALPTNLTAKVWRFIDAQNKPQGPFDTETMKGWHAQGYFQAHTLIRRDDEAGLLGPQWRTLADNGARPFG